MRFIVLQYMAHLDHEGYIPVSSLGNAIKFFSQEYKFFWVYLQIIKHSHTWLLFILNIDVLIDDLECFLRATKYRLFSYLLNIYIHKCFQFLRN